MPKTYTCEMLVIYLYDRNGKLFRLYELEPEALQDANVLSWFLLDKDSYSVHVRLETIQELEP